MKIRRFTTKMTRVGLLLRVLGTVFVAGSMYGIVIMATNHKAEAAGLSFTQFAVHPYASKTGFDANSIDTSTGMKLCDTSWCPDGQTISDMAITNDGKIVAGYGDWAKNVDSYGVAAGGVYVAPIDASTGQWDGTAFRAGSEAIETVRTFGGDVYISQTDPSEIAPTGHPKHTQGIITNKGGNWHLLEYRDAAGKSIANVHSFDSGSLDAGTNDLWAFGVNCMNTGCGSWAAAALHSVNGGNTWSVEYADPTAGTSSSFDEYKWGHDLNNKMYSQARGSIDAFQARVYDNVSKTTSSWGDASQLLCDVDRGRLVEKFDGALICPARAAGTFVVFDGTNIRNITIGGISKLVDFYVSSDNYLYMLMENGDIFRTSSLATSPQKIGTVTGITGQAASILVYNNYIYIGGESGVIYRSTMVLSDMPPVIPSVASISPNTMVADGSMRNVKVYGNDLDAATEVRVGGQPVSYEVTGAGEIFLAIDTSKFMNTNGAQNITVAAYSGTVSAPQKLTFVKLAPQDTYTWSHNITGTEGCLTGPPSYQYKYLSHDAQDNVYATTDSVDSPAAPHRIQKFDKNGNNTLVFGKTGDGPGEFADTINGIAIDQTNNFVYILESSADPNKWDVHTRVVKYDTNGAYITSFGSRGVGNNQFQSPADIAVDSTGNVYVMDSGNGKIKKFASDGTYISSFAVASLNARGGLVIDSLGSIYAANASGDIIEYTPAGVLVKTLIDSPPDTIVSDIALSGTGSFYIADGFSSTTRVYDKTGVFITDVTGGYSPIGVTVLQGAGEVFIADSWNDQVRKYSAGNVQQIAFHYTDPNFQPPSSSSVCGLDDITIGADGNIYALDTSWQNIKVFSQSGTLLRTIPFDSSDMLSLRIAAADGVLYAVGHDTSDSVKYTKLNAADGAIIDSWSVSVGWTQIYKDAYVTSGGQVYSLSCSFADDTCDVEVYSSNGQLLQTIPAVGQAWGLRVNQLGQIAILARSSQANANAAVFATIDTDGRLLTMVDTGERMNVFTVDDLGNIYATRTGDGGMNYIYKYSLTGERIATIGGDCQDASADRCLSGTMAIVVLPNGSLYAAASGTRVSLWNAPIIPSEPRNLAIKSVTNTSATLSWAAPQYVGTDPLTGYMVRYRVVGSTVWHYAVVSGQQTSIQISGLLSNTEYEVEIFSQNTLGVSQLAASMRLHTTQEGSLASTGINLVGILMLTAVTALGGWSVLVVRKMLL